MNGQPPARLPGRPPLPAAALVVAFGLALYLPGLGREILRHPLEAKYALIARDMLRGAPWLVAHHFGELFPDKPPLYFWAIALLARLQGGQVGELTTRLPAVAAAVLGLLAVHRLGRELFGERAGLLAAAVLATSNLFFWYARQGHPDQFLTTFVTLAGLGLWRGFTATSPRQGRRWLVLAYAAMAGAVLSKGLLGLVVPLLAGTAYLLATGPLRAVPGRLGLWPGLAVFLAIVLAWFGPAVTTYGAGYFFEAVVHQHFGRYTAAWSHREPWYFYLGEFPTGFAPWVLFLPGALVLGWQARRTTAPVLFPLGWFAAGFLFFNLSSAKRGPYLLPLYPAAALLVGWLWDRTLANGRPSRWVDLPVGGVGAGAALAAVGLLVVPPRLVPGHTVHTVVPADLGHRALAALLLLAAAGGLWLLWRRRHLAAALAVLVAVQGTVLLAVALIRAGQYEGEFPVRALVVQAGPAVPPGQPVLSLAGDYTNIVAFYLDRPFALLPDPAALLAARRPTAPTYALVTEGQRQELDGLHPTVLAEGPLGPRRFALIRLDPPGR